MSKEKLYLDTSVYGGYYDSEFELWTQVLFNHIQKGQYQIITSNLVEFELIKAPMRIKEVPLLIDS